MSHVPHSLFSTAHLEPEERYAVWKESISVIFDVERKQDELATEFEARLQAYLFEDLILAKTNSSAAHYRRSPLSIRQDGLDMILIQLFIEGEVQFKTGRKVTNAQAGDLVVFDLGQEVANFNTDFHHLSAAFPRELISGIVPRIEHWHGKTLPSGAPMTKLLRQHLLSVFEIGDKVPAASASGIKKATIELIGAAFHGGPVPELAGTETLSATILCQIKRHIRESLTDPSLSPEKLALTFNLSRAQFYRVTKPLDGVMSYIKKLRLQQCLQEIRKPENLGTSLAEIGYRWGFNDYGTFVRSFKSAFTLTPSEAREEGLLATQTGNFPEGMDDKALNRSYENWLRGQQ